jgi:transposase
LKNQEHQVVYEHKVEMLGELETLSQANIRDLYYSDESKVSLTPCIPSGWQFPEEEVVMPTQKGEGLNCFALLHRNNECVVETTTANINAQFVFERLEELSVNLKKLTVVVLDNARIHHSQIIKERLGVWHARGLYLFYLPRYSPHLNIVEILWRKLKYEWLSPHDYLEKEKLFYQVRLALTSVGQDLFIKFSKFRHTLS